MGIFIGKDVSNRPRAGMGSLTSLVGSWGPESGEIDLIKMKEPDRRGSRNLNITPRRIKIFS